MYTLTGKFAPGFDDEWHAILTKRLKNEDIRFGAGNDILNRSRVF
jgi:hypothetical protein